VLFGQLQTFGMDMAVPGTLSKANGSRVLSPSRTGYM
jgi:hypothetical protein